MLQKAAFTYEPEIHVLLTSTKMFVSLVGREKRKLSQHCSNRNGDGDYNYDDTR